MAWVYDTKVAQYRDAKTGRLLSAASMVELRDDFLTRSMASVVELAGELTSGRLSLTRWVDEMRFRVQLVHSTQFAFGRGGRKVMTAQDRADLGQLVSQQYAYLNRFAGEVALGRLSPDQIADRASMYVSSAVGSYELGRATAYGVRGSLPVWPGDGGTQCLARCRCHWRYTNRADGAVSATWVLDPAAEHCPDCERRASDYQDYLIIRGGAA